jgi:hypothetical protein
MPVVPMAGVGEAFLVVGSIRGLLAPPIDAVKIEARMKKNAKFLLSFIAIIGIFHLPIHLQILAVERQQLAILQSDLLAG